MPQTPHQRRARDFLRDGNFNLLTIDDAIEAGVAEGDRAAIVAVARHIHEAFTTGDHGRAQDLREEFVARGETTFEVQEPEDPLDGLSLEHY